MWRRKTCRRGDTQRMAKSLRSSKELSKYLLVRFDASRGAPGNGPVRKSSSRSVKTILARSPRSPCSPRRGCSFSVPRSFEMLRVIERTRDRSGSLSFYFYRGDARGEARRDAHATFSPSVTSDARPESLSTRCFRGSLPTYIIRYQRVKERRKTASLVA